MSPDEFLDELLERIPALTPTASSVAAIAADLFYEVTRCPACSGTGIIPGDTGVPCSICNGTGDRFL